MSPRRLLESYGGRAALLIVGCTLTMTACFVGLLALLSGDAVGTTGRFPYYVLALATAFVAAVFGFSGEDTPARVVILGAVGAGVVAFVAVSLAAEGIAHAVRNPGDVFGSQLIVYLVSAALIGTGLTTWGLNYWRELAGANGASGASDPDGDVPEPDDA